jgi:hypothetical protein
MKFLFALLGSASTCGGGSLSGIRCLSALAVAGLRCVAPILTMGFSLVLMGSFD